MAVKVSGILETAIERLMTHGSALSEENQRFPCLLIFLTEFSFTEESYTVRLPVNVLNTVKEGEGGKPFTKIGFIEFPSDATLRELREKLKKDFTVLLQGKVFLFQDAMMADVEPSSEETTKIMYNLSVIIRLANNQGNDTRDQCLVSCSNIETSS